MTEPTEKAIAEAVRQRIKDRHPGGVNLEVLDKEIRLDEGLWYVPILPSAQPPRTFEYYEILSEVEVDIQEQENVDVLLIPALPD
ncbi:MAG: hypothetical protein IT210_13980 [Armatimonadetes bacterium]|nr:hypothetical protein [Armatimonadota bacterium]